MTTNHNLLWHVQVQVLRRTPIYVTNEAARICDVLVITKLSAI